MNLNHIIIIGSGASIRPDFNVPINQLPIWSYIKNEPSIAINWGFLFFKPTIELFTDWQFYVTERKSLSTLPLIIGRNDVHFQHKGANFISHSNTILLKWKTKWIPIEEQLKNGLYLGGLSGSFALSLAIALGYKEIFLCGFDMCAVNGHTHFYQDQQGIGITLPNTKDTNTGVGKRINGEYKTSAYNNDDINKKWLPFKKVETKIYNVSLNSKLNVFPKITYNELYQQLATNPSNIDHDEIRKEIKNKLI